MDLKLNMELAKNYKSNSQKIRVATEAWIEQYAYCPYCGNSKLNSFENNRPVADFYCEKCHSQYELKSKSGKIGNKITDGAYETMIDRISSNENPNLFVLTYNRQNYGINNLLMVPKYFFSPKIIEKRKPLSSKAKRPGWVGCNILITEIPKQALVYIIKNNQFIDRKLVENQVLINNNLKVNKADMRGWLLDILICIEKISRQEFSLKDMYEFELLLRKKHPNNKNIKAKIRQQLQYLRDKGIIDFIGNGNYRKNIF